jgi:D-alanyl-D-alanine carboxypeptidase
MRISIDPGAGGTIVCWLVISTIALSILVLMPQVACAQLGAKPGSIVISVKSGRVLQADNPDVLRFPASLTKMMTLYLTFDALRHHRITLKSRVPVSRHAASMEPTKLWLVPGSRITVQQCILGMVTVSANDAAAAVGELLGGSESRFARLMTRRAKKLGMRHTVFRNASGLPDPAQVTTAHDMAILARALILHYPEFYSYFGITRFRFHGRTIYGHDPMLGTYAGADGLKTGYTSAAGFNMATSAIRNKTRIVGVVLGADSVPDRSAEMISLLDQGFNQYGNAEVASAAPLTPHLFETASAAELPVTPAMSYARPVPHTTISRVVRSAPRGYVVQVGSFRSRTAALHAVRLTVATVGGVAHVRRFLLRGRTVWRGRVASLTRAGAYRICPRRARKAGRCLVMGPHLLRR